MKKSLLLVILSTWMLVFAFPGDSLAQNRYEIARALATTALDLALENRFDEALTLLENAYIRDPVPVLLYNMGRIFHRKGDLPTARKAFERYLVEETDDAEGIALAKTLLLEVKMALPRSLQIRSDRPGAEVFWDGVSIGRIPMEAGTYDVGKHHLMIKHCGYVTAQQEVDVLPGEDMMVFLPLARAPAQLHFSCEGKGTVRIDQEPFGECPMKKSVEKKAAKYIMEIFSAQNVRTLHTLDLIAGAVLYARYNEKDKSLELRYEGECVDEQGKPLPASTPPIPVSAAPVAIPSLNGVR